MIIRNGYHFYFYNENKYDKCNKARADFAFVIYNDICQNLKIAIQRRSVYKRKFTKSPQNLHKTYTNLKFTKSPQNLHKISTNLKCYPRLTLPGIIKLKNVFSITRLGSYITQNGSPKLGRGRSGVGDRARAKPRLSDEKNLKNRRSETIDIGF